MSTMSSFNIQYYAGKWYEVARSKNDFETPCVESMAYYKFVNQNSFEILNKCVLEDGSEYGMKGIAYSTDPVNPRKFSVVFGKIKGDYLVFWVDGLKNNQYQIAIVLSKTKLWILAREYNTFYDYKNKVFNILQKIKVNPYALIWVKPEFKRIYEPEPPKLTINKHRT